MRMGNIMDKNIRRGLYSGQPPTRSMINSQEDPKKSIRYAYSKGYSTRALIISVMIIVLGIVFLKIIISDENKTTPPKDEEKVAPAVTEKTPEVVYDDTDSYEYDEDDSYTEEDSYAEEDYTDEMEEETEVTLGLTGEYKGYGEVEEDDQSTTWEFNITFMEDDFLSVEGVVKYNDYVSELYVELEFTLSANRLEMYVWESETGEFDIKGVFDMDAVNLFSIDEQRQFFVYVTPKKVNATIDSIPEKFNNVNESTPLIDMRGFISEDGKIFGTFHTPFVPSIQYELGLIGMD